MRADLIFAGLFAALFAFLALEAGQWNYRSSLFPEVIGVAGLVAAAVLVFVRVVLKRMPAPSPLSRAVSHPPSKPGVAPQAASPPRESGAENLRALRLLAWIGGVVCLSWLLGQMVAMSLFMLAFLRVEARVGWPASALGAALTGGFLYAVFDRVLVVTWLDGALYGWLGTVL